MMTFTLMFGGILYLALVTSGIVLIHRSKKVDKPWIWRSKIILFILCLISGWMWAMI